MKWPSQKVRTTFLEYFKEHGHAVVKSAPLLPRGDETLLFTNAGMNQFKSFFLGEIDPPFKTAASVQKCLRAGGKHNDLENVGKTTRHHTFFEMLGNFSFGGYFKREAIRYAWEFLTDVCELPKERFFATVYRDDDVAYDIWKDEIGLPGDRILRLGEKDNFWEMGEVGPCGPSSELHFDLGEEMDPDQKDPGQEGERFSEIWNLVFTEFDRRADRSLEPLPRKNIDTGMGFERLCTALQGVRSNYETDLFTPILEEIERITDRPYDSSDSGTPHRVIADHVRGLTFAIADGIFPSNLGRGYVLRRILRRAHRYADKIDVREPILYRLVPVVVDVMGEAYPEIRERTAEIELVIKSEEERFLTTMAANLPLLEEALERAKDRGVLPGEEIFKLYDTFGLPLDLIEECALDAGLEIDGPGFERAMTEQRDRAGKKKEIEEGAPWTVLVPKYGRTEFLGYRTLESEGEIVKHRERRDGKLEIVLDRTPFYAEAGGQVGDRGTLSSDGFLFEVEDAQFVGEDRVHIGQLKDGTLDRRTVLARVNPDRRIATRRSHTATHLLQATLREVLGEHVRQEGSLVEPDRFRFDFTHYEPMTREEIRKVEALVNRRIMENHCVTVEEKTYRDAIEEGAIALFVEKYTELVRIVSIEDVSKELCGGTHAERTGDLGLFRIEGEGAVSAGVRRIEAFTGERALQHVFHGEDELQRIAEELKAEPDKLPERIERMKREREELERNYQNVLGSRVPEVAERLLREPETIGDVRFYYGKFDTSDPDPPLRVGDIVTSKSPEPYVYVGASGVPGGDSLSFMVKVSPDLTKVLSAVDLVREIGRKVKGGGGGSRTKAQGGGKDPSKLPEAIDAVKRAIEASLNG
jgi:alanyl-tRNA synthetase